MNAVPAKAGWQWIVSGLALFRRQPGLLTSLLVINMLAMLLLSQLPYAGTPVALVLIPSFGIALMQACATIARGERALPGVVLTGFRQPAVTRLCQLGLVYLAMFGLVTLLKRVMVSEELMTQLAKPGPVQGQLQVDGGDLLAVLAFLVLQVVAVMVLSFATPLAYWKQMSAFKAVFYSFFAVMRAWRAFLFMMMCLSGIFMGALMVLLLIFGNGQLGQAALMWAMLMSGLIQQCAIYCAYQQIFGAPDELPAS